MKRSSIMLHFIWVFTVCLSTRNGVSSMQRVKGYRAILTKNSEINTCFGISSIQRVRVIKPYLQRILEIAEVLHLGSEEQVTKLGEGQEDDEEHNGKTSQILGTLSESRGQLSHRLVEADVLEDL